MRERGSNPESMERGGIASTGGFVRSKFHSTANGDAAPAPLPVPEGAPTGSRFFGRYELLDVLGRGGMGAVYRARDRDAGRDVALKVTSRQDNAVNAERFRREGQITASLDHPGIVGVHAAGHENSIPWIAYELVEGKTLSEAFDEVPRETRVRYVIDAAEALAYAHARGVVHRDVKPGNILVEAGTGRVRVADFGLALGVSMDRMTLTGAFIGTPLFMPPEQFDGKKGELASSSDVWSLGVILYLALTGEVPFDGANLLELCVAIKEGDPKPPRGHDSSIDPQLEAVCLRALAPDPAERYPDGAALAADLESALRGESEASELRARRRLRRGLVLAFLTLFASGLALGLGLALQLPAPQPQETPKPADGQPSPKKTSAALKELRQALASDELVSLAEALKGDVANSIPPRDLEALRDDLLSAGLRRLESSAGSGLDPVFLAAGRLNAALPSPASRVFAHAVLSKAAELENASAEGLENPLVLSLIEGLASAQLPGPPNPTQRLLEAVSTLGLRPPHALFGERLQRLLLGLLSLQADVQDHVRALNRQPVERLTGTHQERLLWAMADESRRDKRRDKAFQEGVAETFRALFREATPETLGRLNYVRGMLRTMRYIELPQRPGAREEAFNRLLELAPREHRLLRSAGRELYHLAVAALAAGRTQDGVRLVERALDCALSGQRRCEDLGVEDSVGLRNHLFRMRETQIPIYVLLGRGDQASAILSDVPSWVSPGGVSDLRKKREEARQLRKRYLGPDHDIPQLSPWAGTLVVPALDPDALRSFHERRLAGISAPLRTDLLRATVDAAQGVRWKKIWAYLQDTSAKLAGSPPESARVAVETARLCLGRNQLDLARSFLQHARQAPGFDGRVRAQADLLLGESHWRAGRLGAALETFEAVASNTEAPHEQRCAQAQAAWLRGDTRSMLRATDAALQTSPGEPVATTLRGLGLIDQRRYVDAIGVLDKAARVSGGLDSRLTAARTLLALERIARDGQSPADLEIRRESVQRYLAVEQGLFAERLLVQLGLASPSTNTRRWAATRLVALDQAEPGHPHTLLLAGYSALLADDPETCTERWTQARRIDPSLPIPAPYLEQYGLAVSPAQADALRSQ